MTCPEARRCYRKGAGNRHANSVSHSWMPPILAPSKNEAEFLRHYLHSLYELLAPLSLLWEKYPIIGDGSAQPKDLISLLLYEIVGAGQVHLLKSWIKISILLSFWPLSSEPISQPNKFFSAFETRLPAQYFHIVWDRHFLNRVFQLATLAALYQRITKWSLCDQWRMRDHDKTQNLLTSGKQTILYFKAQARHRKVRTHQGKSINPSLRCHHKEIIRQRPTFRFSCLSFCPTL